MQVSVFENEMSVTKLASRLRLLFMETLLSTLWMH